MLVIGYMWSLQKNKACFCYDFLNEFVIKLKATSYIVYGPYSTEVLLCLYDVNVF